MKVSTTVELTLDEVRTALIDKARELAKVNAGDITVGSAHIKFESTEPAGVTGVVVTFSRGRT